MPYSSAALAAGLSSHLSTSSRPPDSPDEHGIWIRIPTRLITFETTDGRLPSHLCPPDLGDEEPLEAPPASAPPRAVTTTAPRLLPTPVIGDPVFRRCGESRELTFGGRTVVLADRIGFRLYAALLARPHLHTTAVELRAAQMGVDAACFAGSTGPLMSSQGVEFLRQRYEELSEELAEAEQRQDPLRQERLEIELGHLAEQVRKAVGRQGRVRQQSDAERARIAVTKALARARDLLRVHHPAFCDHLVASVSIGSVLVYHPSDQLRWTV